MRIEKGFSQRKLQDKSGVERNFLSLIENNHRSPSFKTLMRIASAMDVSVGYITDYHEKEIGDASVLPENYTAVKTLQQVLKERQDVGKGNPINFFPTPILTEAGLAADLTHYKEKDIEDYVFISDKLVTPPVKSDRYRCLWIRDEEKALPPIIDVGSLICIDSHQRDPHLLEDELVVFHYPKGGCMVRRLRYHADHILGLPEKPMQQQPLIIPVSEHKAILGKVIWCWNKFNKNEADN
ncbi:MAG: helix-turn-helix transcriptional regulator [Candidatus Schekmanbacteria bacterium]|nr:helix-turn-helix transcriptional regulator [Candidatus Schekmanbacteria bacterium]